MSSPPLQLVFSLYKYFPHGGMQRAFLRIAACCLQAGAQVRVHTLEWQGEVPAGLDVRLVQASAVFNHTRYQRFHSAQRRLLRADTPDCVVGFNKMPDLDIYYAADTCYLEKAMTARTLLYRQTPRFRHFAQYERAVFAPDHGVHILMSSPTQHAIYQRHYGTLEPQFHMLPPGIARDRMAGEDAPERRLRGRRSLGIAADELLLLLIGSGFITKGLDRALDAVAALPMDLQQRVRLVAVGTDAPRRFHDQARRLGLADRFQVLAGRDDIPDLLQAGDLLVHPAYFENTGNVLLEAVVAGLPVLTTDVCGFAPYVLEAGAGRVLSSPYRQAALDAALLDMLSPEQGSQREEWRRAGIAFGRRADLYSLPARAAAVILQIAENKRAHRVS